MKNTIKLNLDFDDVIIATTQIITGIPVYY